MDASTRYQLTLVTFQVPRNKHRRNCQNYHHHHIQVGPLETELSSKWRVFECAALSKQGQRFLSSLATATAARGNSATNRSIKKFVAASPKSIALDALSRLLSPNSSYFHLSSLAFPIWDALESKLDLHGMHIRSAYLIMLLWFEEMKNRFNGGNDVIPAEITVVCGSGNHSIVRGESPVKRMIKSIMVQTRSPMRVDRKNLGCFIAKGKVVKEWLS